MEEGLEFYHRVSQYQPATDNKGAVFRGNTGEFHAWMATSQFQAPKSGFFLREICFCDEKNNHFSLPLRSLTEFLRAWPKMWRFWPMKAACQLLLGSFHQRSLPPELPVKDLGSGNVP